ncbi:MAG: hypothetical protein ABFC24_11645 [Methanoregulaceae archaeon]
MKKKSIGIGFILIVLLVTAAQATSPAGTASTVTVTTIQDAVTQIFVSSVTLDPEIFYPGETGTVTVHVTNGGNATVCLGNPTITDPHIKVYDDDTLKSKTYIGGGGTADFAFKISVSSASGKNTYFPIFSVTPDVGTAVHESFELQTDSNDLQASVTGKPDTFTLDNAGTVNLTFMNPREAAIKNIHVSATGPDLTINPTDQYISSLETLNSSTLGFSVTPGQNSNLTFNISYASSDNVYYKNVILPVSLGVDKTAAVPVVNNPSLTTKNSYYDLTADITNAGISDAKGLVVTVGSPATATGTYTEYAVGSLAADDSSSFEITFTCEDLSNVPLEISWKDSQGNNYNTTKVMDFSTISSGTGTSGSSLKKSSSSTTFSSSMSGGSGGNMGGPGGSGGGPSGGGLFGSSGSGLSAFYPIIAGGILIVLAAVLWVKRKWILAKIKKQ